MSLAPPPKILIVNIRVDPDLQIREEINEHKVAEYAKLMKDGIGFPPVDVYRDGSGYILAGGFHRVAAAQVNGESKIPAKVHRSRQEALKHALKDNSSHGLPLTTADKRRGIELALREWPTLSSREIGRMCGVDHKTVESVRNELGKSPNSKSRIGRDGKVRKPKRTIQEVSGEIRYKQFKIETEKLLGLMRSAEKDIKKAQSFTDQWWKRMDLASALDLLGQARKCIEVPKWGLGTTSKLPPPPKPKPA